MSNSYHDLTGVLRLKQVTPIIKALFGGLSLDPDYPGNGEAYFARMRSLDSRGTTHADPRTADFQPDNWYGLNGAYSRLAAPGETTWL